MIGKILTTAWPVLVPVIIYVIWLYKELKIKDIKVDDEFLKKKRRYMFYALYACALIVMVLLLIYGLNVEEGNLSHKTYD